MLYVALLALGVVILMAPPVQAQEEKPFTIHGEVRFRGEYSDNTTDFDKNFDDGGLFWPYRVRIAAEGHFSKNISAWIEFQNAAVAGQTDAVIGGVPVFHNGTGGEIGNDGSAVEMYQGNLTIDQLWSKNFSLRIGRQEIVAGNELLLGDLDFYSGLSHDGLVGNWKLRKSNLMLWYTRPIEGQIGFSLTGLGANTPPDQLPIVGSTGSTTQNFLGGYWTTTIFKNQNLDVYLMELQDRSVGANFQTAGARWAREANAGLFWNVEYAQQFGQASSGYVTGSGTDVDAGGHAIEAWAGWAFKMGKNSHRLFGRYEEASGDKASSTKNEGFIPLFGDFHNRLGHGDWFHMADASTGLGGGVTAGGIKAWSVGYTGYFRERHELGAAYWDYTQAEDNGAASDKLGTAYDVWYGFNYSRNLTFTASVSQLNPDDALTGGGAAPNDAVMRIYGQARLRF